MSVLGAVAIVALAAAARRAAIPRPPRSVALSNLPEAARTAAAAVLVAICVAAPGPASGHGLKTGFADGLFMNPRQRECARSG